MKGSENSSSPPHDDEKPDVLETIREKEEKEAQERLARRLGLPFVNLALVPIKREVFELIPKKRAEEAELAVFDKRAHSISIGIVSPENPKTKLLLDELKRRGFSYTIFVVTKSALEEFCTHYPEIKERGPKISGELSIHQEILNDVVARVKTFDEFKTLLKRHAADPTSEILETLLAGSLILDASDIHIEPQEDASLIRYRVDGMLNDIEHIAPHLHGLLVSRIKIISHLLLNVSDVNQDGRFSIISGKDEIEVRVSIIPSEYGESIALRILNPKLLLSISELGLRRDLEERVREQIRAPYGMILVVGPTGSGKTTTLYAFINHIKSPSIKIITIEDPIEYRIEGISQSQVNPEKKYDFSDALRAILRQDPDVILVGEMRDPETVSTSLQAALTGHLVFSTLHTNDAAGAIPRLIDMKANPALVSPSLDLIIAQRLVRRLCTSCKKERGVLAAERKKIEAHFEDAPPEIKAEFMKKTARGVRLWQAIGCPLCLGGGYKRRIGIFEILDVDEEIERMILASPSISDLRKRAKEKGMATMMQDGILKVLDGTTSLEEIFRVTQ